uniref:Myotubularin-related protein 10-like n=1 Tax=Sinocyclocheilus anshuiensis TaxID=1608454 RepID=A0A671PJ34_9TELE
MFSGKQTKPTFKSYLPPLQTDSKKSPQLPIKKLEAKLLPGEIVVNEANFVRKCISAESCQDDLWGKLVCTNFKVSFITHNSLPRQRFQCTHRLLGEHDIPLACVEQVVTVNDVKGKQKILGSNQKLKFNPTELILYCKDFRIIRFRFDEAGPESAKKVCLAIAHYSHPADPQLLFGFEYVGKRYHGSTGERVSGIDPGGGMQTTLFDCSSDWDREIKRIGASEWRVCTINQGYFISPSLPEFFVVPVSLADQDLKQYACFFYSQRIPLWCWNHSSGSALVRMSNISDPQQQRKVEQRISSAITKSHPLRSDVFKSDLDKNLPNIQDIQAALLKLRQICVIDPFEESEEKWLSSLESSRWMEYVRTFLRHAVEVVYMLESRNVPVILLEKEDRDLSCVISCLVQLMCDPHCRSLHGFQSLIQKEWVMAGHRFLDRCNHLKKNDKEESPVFLLFLDCVWQLWNQYPAAFEFTEVYLTVLGDSMWVPIFSTFLFNCPRQRAENSRVIVIYQITHFYVFFFFFTSLLYFLRWVPEAQIPQGGPITAFHKLSVLTDEIDMLLNQLRQYKGAGGTPNSLHAEHSKMYFKATSTPHQPPAPPEYLSSSFPFSPVGNLCRPGILGSPLSKFLNGAKIWLSTETLANETI